MIHIIVFLISCLVLYVSYNQTYNYLQYNTIQFQHLDENRKYYMCKNIVKGCYLSVLTVAGVIPIFYGIVYDVWDNDMIRIIASMYVSNDVVGMYRVENLPTSTRLHHTAAVFLLIMAWNIDFQRSNTGQLLTLYTYFSALSFPVNLYLGLRFCYEVRWLRKLSKHLYLYTCLANWVVQIKWSTDVSFMYILLILVIIVDDLVLLRWLWFKRQ
jgi:hypothetical protein